jgi:hypothetical protein
MDEDYRVDEEAAASWTPGWEWMFTFAATVYNMGREKFAGTAGRVGGGLIG